MAQTQIRPQQIVGLEDGWIDLGDFGDYTFTCSGSEVATGTKQYEVHLNDGMDLLSYISAGMKVR